MRRRVIQIANSTQLISLPRKWAERYNVKKGDELEIEEQGNKLVINTEKILEYKKKEFDVSGLDRTTILYGILALYKIGYDEVVVRFNEQFTIHLRTGEKKKIGSVLHDIVNRLSGFEIIEEKEKYCVIKDMAEVSNKDFDSALRRVFLLLVDINNDLLKASRNKDMVLADSLEFKHDNVMKFISFCLRALNKNGYINPSKTIILYHILSNIDKIVDILKYSSRDLMQFNIEFSKEGLSILNDTCMEINSYYDFFYKFDMKKISEMYQNRDRILKRIRKMAPKAKPVEVLYLTNLCNTLELITDISEARIGLEN